MFVPVRSSISIYHISGNYDGGKQDSGVHVCILSILEKKMEKKGHKKSIKSALIYIYHHTTFVVSYYIMLYRIVPI